MTTPPEDLSQALFILWPDALHLSARIRADLARETRILADFRVHWSEENLQRNLQRLYRQPIRTNEPPRPRSRKAPRPELHAFYVECAPETVALHRSATGEIERTNALFPRKKSLYRDWALSEPDPYPFLVHCAGTRDEVRLQTPLIFGGARADALWRGQELGPGEITGDPEGAQGWPSLRAALQFLERCTDWCALRGWQDLPDAVSGSDLDIMVRDNRTASSALALTHAGSDRHLKSGTLALGDREIDVDLHWIGDGYLDPVWEQHILDHRTGGQGVSRPCPEDAFFAMIYSEFVHRTHPRAEKIERIRAVGREIAHTGWMDALDMHSRDAMVELLAGYMKSRNYVWVAPRVHRLRQSAAAVAALPKPPPVVRDGPEMLRGMARKGARAPRRYMVALARRVLPARVYDALRRAVKGAP